MMAASVRTMNSSAISKRLSEPYNDLLSGRRWLASSPGVFFWAGEHAVLRGGLATCQHVPLRVWVGITPHTRKGDPEVLAYRDPEHHLFLMPETEAHEEHFAPIANFMESASMASKLRRVAALARENGIEGEIRDPHAPLSLAKRWVQLVRCLLQRSRRGTSLCRRQTRRRQGCCLVQGGDSRASRFSRHARLSPVSHVGLED